MAFTDDEINEFRIEAVELLTAAEQALLSIDKGGDFKGHFDAIFRAFHSVKGAAGMMEMTDLQAHVHQLESALVSVKNNAQLTREQLDYFLSGCDSTSHLLHGRAVTPLNNFPNNAGCDSPPKDLLSSVNLEHPLEALQPQKVGMVVVIDDDVEVAESLTDIISDNGFEVRMFTNPKEGVKYLVNNPVDVVFTDMMMPELSGVEVLRSIKKIDPFIPVIFVTGQCSKDELIEAINSGVHFVIEKPWRNEIVINQAKKALQVKRLNALVNSSINLLISQFSDYDKFLKEQSRDGERSKLKVEILKVLDQKNLVRKLAS